ncbi:MAG: hypothetical protein U0903_10185 [Planctomycetales bacterium]
MTGYTVHTGSSEKFSAGWDQIFKGTAKKKTAASKTAVSKKKATKPKGKKATRKKKG